MNKASFSTKKRFSFTKLIVCLLSVLTFLTVITFNFDIKVKASEEVSSEFVSDEVVEMEEETKKATVKSCSSASSLVGSAQAGLWFAIDKFTLSSDQTYVTFLYSLCNGTTVVDTSAVTTEKYCVTSRDSNSSATCTPGTTFTDVTITLPSSGSSFYVGVTLITTSGTISTGSGTLTRNYVAKIGSTGYGTLQKAIDAASTSTSSTSIITIQKNISETATVSTYKNMGINLNGKTWTCSSTCLSVGTGATSSSISVYGGSITSSGSTSGLSLFSLNYDGTFGLKDVDAEVTNTSGSVIKVEGGSPTIRIGDLTDTTTNMRLVSSGTAGTGIYADTGATPTINVNKGLIKGAYPAIQSDGTATLNIGPSGALPTELQVISAARPISLTSDSSLSFNGGFIGTTDSLYANDVYNVTPSSSKTIYEVSTTIDSFTYYGYMADEGVASVGNKHYVMLKDAFASLTTTAATVKLFSNVSECISVSSAINATINLNGKTWSCSDWIALSVSNSATITITDTSSSVGTITSLYYAIYAESSTINVYKGIISSTTTESLEDAIHVSNSATLNIGNPDGTSTTSNLQVLANAGKAIYADGANVTILGGLITSASSNAIYFYGYNNSDKTLQIGNTITSTSDNLRILSKTASTYAVYIDGTDASKYFYSGFIGASSSSYYAYCGSSACGTSGWTGKTGTLKSIGVTQDSRTYNGYVPAIVYASNGKYYASMHAAFANAGVNNGRTFTLQASFSESVSFNSAVNFTIDLNGKTWTSSGSGYVIYTEEGDNGGASGNITITSSVTGGTIKTTSGTAIVLNGYVKMTVKYGIIFGYIYGVKVGKNAELVVGVSGTTAYATLKIYASANYGIYITSGATFTYINGFIGSAAGSSSNYSYAYNSAPTSNVPIADASYSSYYGKSKGVAVMKDVYYYSLSAAVSASSSYAYTVTIKLLEDINESLRITDANVEFDLNGKSWTASSSYPLYLYGSDADVTVNITDTSSKISGTIYTTGTSYPIYISNSGGYVSLTLKKGNIVNKGSNPAIYVTSTAANTGAYITLSGYSSDNMYVSNSERESALKVITNSTYSSDYAIKFGTTSCSNCYLLLLGGFVASKAGYDNRYNIEPAEYSYTIAKSYVTYSEYTYTGSIATQYPVAKIGSTYYSKMSDAVIDSSTSSGTTTTITLVTSLFYESVDIIGSTRYITIDLNGKSWYAASNSYALKISSNSSVITIKDSGSYGLMYVNSENPLIYLHYHTGTLNLLSGEFEQGVGRQEATLQITGGSPTINIGDSNSTIDNLQILNDNEDGVAISASSGTINIYRGLIIGFDYGITISSGVKLNVGAPKYSSSEDNLRILSTRGGDGIFFTGATSSSPTTFTFNGGFVGAYGSNYYAYNEDASYTTIKINGYILDKEIAHTVNGTSKTFTGKVVYPVKIEDTYYPSVTEATKAASSHTNPTIVFGADTVYECVLYTVDANVTFDLNGTTWSCTGGNALNLSGSTSSYTVTITDNSGSVGKITTNSDTVRIAFAGTVEVLKGKIITTSTSENYGAIWDTAGTLIIGDSNSTTNNLQIEGTAARGLHFTGSSLTINQGVMKSTSSKGINIASSSSEVTINNGTFSSSTGSGLYITGGTVTIPDGKVPIFTGTKGNGIYISGGTLNMNGGNSTGYKALYVAGGTVNINNAATKLSGRDDERSVSTYSVYATGSSAKVTINDGYFKTDDYYIYAASSATVTVNGGKFYDDSSFVYASGATVTINDGTFEGSITAVSSAKVTIIKGTPSNIEVSSSTLVYGDSSTTTVDNLKTEIDSTSKPAIKATSSTVTIYNGFIYNSTGNALQLSSSTAYIYKGRVVSDSSTTGYYAIHSTSSNISIGNSSSTINNLYISSRYKIAIYQSGGTTTIIRGLIDVGNTQAIELDNSAKFNIGDSTSTVDNLIVVGWNSASKITSGTVTIYGGFYGAANESSYGTVTVASGYTKYNTTIRKELDDGYGTMRKFYGISASSGSVSGYASTTYNSVTYLYSTIQKAIEFLDENTSTSQTITLHQTESGQVTIKATKNGTIDLNGQTWTNYAKLLISGGTSNTSNLTITNSSSTLGLMKHNTSNLMQFDFAGTLTLLKGKFEGAFGVISVSGEGRSNIVIGGSTSTVDNLKVIATNTSGGAGGYAIEATNSVNITINNGYISGASQAIHLEDVYTGKLTIYKGIIKGGSTYNAVYVDGDQYEVQIGDATTTSETLKLLSGDKGLNLVAMHENGVGIDAVINGGFITGGYSCSTTLACTVEVNGMEQNTTTTYDGTTYSGIRVVVAMIDSTYYETIANAIAAASSNTVKLISDRDENVTISSTKTVIIDLNGYTWASYGSSNVPLTMSSATSSITINVTITDNSSSVGTITGAKGISFGYGTLKIYKGLIKGTNGAGIYATGTLAKTLIIGKNGVSDNKYISIYGSTYGIYYSATLSQHILTMYGGYIKGYNASGIYFVSGGSSSSTASELNIYGGTIIGNNSNYAVYASYPNSTHKYGPNVQIGNTNTTIDDLKIINLYSSSGYAVKVQGYNSSYKATLTINGGFLGSAAGASYAYTTTYTTVTINGALDESTASYEYREKNVVVSSGTVSGKKLVIASYNDWDETTYCDTLQECFDRLPLYNEDNDGVPVITLLADRNESVTVTESKIGILDLNGHVWAGAVGLRIEGTDEEPNHSIITIEDNNASYPGSMYGSISALYFSGTLSLLKGNYTGGVTFNGNGTLIIGEEGEDDRLLTMTLELSYVSTDYSVIDINGVDYQDRDDMATLIINSGMIGSDTAYAVKSDWCVDVNVKGGYVYGGLYAIHTDQYSYIEISGDALIEGKLNEEATMRGAIYTYQYGSITMNGGTVSNGSGKGDAITVESVMTLYLNSGTIEGRIYSFDYLPVVIGQESSSNDDMLIEGEIEASYLYVDMYRGTIRGNLSGNGTFKIYSGIIIGNVSVSGSLIIGVVDTSQNIYSSSKDIAILGAYLEDGETQTSEVVSVYSGSFTFNRGFLATTTDYPNGYYCASSVTCTSYANTTTNYVYGGTEYYGIAVAVASIGSDKYLTLEDAFDELDETSKTITLLGHVEEIIDLDLDKYKSSTIKGTIDLNGKTWYGVDNGLDEFALFAYFEFEGNLSLIITDSSAENTGYMHNIYFDMVGGSADISLYKGTFLDVCSYIAGSVTIGNSESTSSNLRVLNSVYLYQGSIIYNGGFVVDYVERVGNPIVNGQETSATITYNGVTYTGTKLLVAKVTSGSNTYDYETLQDAFDSEYVKYVDDGSDKVTITLLSDRTERVALTNKIKAILDLDSYVWSDPDDGNYSNILDFTKNDTVTAGSYLKITGDGQIKTVNQNPAIYINASILDVSDATIGNSSLSTPAIYGAGYSGSKIYLQSGARILSYYYPVYYVSDVYIYNEAYVETNIQEVNSVTIYGGVVKGSIYVTTLDMRGGAVYSSSTINVTSKLIFRGGFIGTTSSTQTDGLYTPYSLGSNATKEVYGLEVNATQIYYPTTYYGRAIAAAHINYKGEYGTAKYYTTLQDAFDDLSGTGEVIVLDTDLYDEWVMLNGHSGYLDLNGHTWSGDSLLQVDSGVLHIIDNSSGTVGSIGNSCTSDCTYYNTIEIWEGTLYLEKGFISSKAGTAIVVTDESYLYVGDSSVSSIENLRIWTEDDEYYSVDGSTESASIIINGGFLDGDIGVGSNFTINGGTIEGTIYANENSTLNIYKGIIHSAGKAIDAPGSTINIGKECTSDACAYSSPNELQILSDYNSDGIIEGATINFNGGFIGDDAEVAGATIFYTDEDTTININGSQMNYSITYNGTTYSGITLAAAHIDGYGYYTTLEEAFEFAQGASAMITSHIILDRNICEMISVSATRAIIDLNGYTWSYVNTVAYTYIDQVFGIFDESEITIIDSSASVGTMRYTQDQAPFIKVNNSTLNIYRGNIIGSYYAIYASNNSTINVGQHGEQTSSCVNGVMCDGASDAITELGDIKIEGYYALSSFNSNVNVYGGVIITNAYYTGYAIEMNGGSLTIGDDYSSADNLQILNKDTESYPAVNLSNSATLTFNGGFVGAAHTTTDSNNFYKAFSSNPTDSRLSNWEITYSGTTYYGLTITGVARIDSTYYKTLRAAIFAAGNNDKTVVLVSNVNEQVIICGDIVVTIDLNGFTWSYAGDVLVFKSGVSESTDVTIIDSSEVSTESISKVSSSNGSAIVVESGANPIIHINYVNVIYGTDYGINAQGGKIYTDSSVTNRSVTISGVKAGVRAVGTPYLNLKNTVVTANTGIIIDESEAAPEIYIDSTTTITGSASAGISMSNSDTNAGYRESVKLDIYGKVSSLYIPGGADASNKSYVYIREGAEIAGSVSISNNTELVVAGSIINSEYYGKAIYITTFTSSCSSSYEWNSSLCGSISIQEGAYISGYAGIQSNYTNVPITVDGGEVIGTSQSAISFGGGTITINGGTITGGIEQSGGVLNINGGTIANTYYYAVSSSSGTFNYTGGRIRISNQASVEYTYYLDADVNNISTYEEYTDKSAHDADGNYVQTQVVTGVAKIDGTVYNTLQEAIDNASENSVIELQESFTPGHYETINGKIRKIYTINIENKYITIKMNNNTINHYKYDTTKSGSQTPDHSFINIKGGSVQLEATSSGGYNIDASGTSLVSAIYNDEGMFILGNNSGSVTMPSYPRIYTNGYTIYNVNQATFMFNSGHLIATNEDVYYLEKDSSNPNKSSKLIILEGHRLVKSPTDSLDYQVYLEEGTMEGSIGFTLKYEVNTTSGDLTINAIAKKDTKGKLSIGMATKGETYVEYECYFDNSDDISKCSTTIDKDDLVYLYNVTYENEIFVKYASSSDSAILETLFVEDLNIVPIRDSSNCIVGHNSETETRCNIADENIEIQSDGSVLLVIIRNGESADLQTYKNIILQTIFGEHYEDLIILGEDSTLPSLDNCVIGDAGVCTNVTSMTIGVNYQDNVPVGVGGTSSITYNKIIVYNVAPQEFSDTTQNQSVVACEYGSECNVANLSFVDYNGNEVTNVTNIVTLNGEVVDKVDTTKLGSYVVTTYAVDAMGYRSMNIVRTYNVVDTVAPVIDVKSEVLYVEKGHRIRNWDISAYDNFDEDVKVEVITSKVNFNKKGSYKVTYKAIDSSGNTTIIEGTIVVRNNIEIILTSVVMALVVVIGVMGYVIYRKKKELV